MGLSLRRALRMGPHRVNLSGAEIGLAARVGGRVWFGPRGTCVSLSRWGFRYRADIVDRESGERGSALVSSDEVLGDMRRRAARGGATLIYALGAGPVWIATMQTEPGWWWGAAFALLVGGGVALRGWERRRRTSRLRYDADDPHLAAQIALAHTVGEELARAAGLWRIAAKQEVDDIKRNAGAEVIIRRTPVRCLRRDLPLMVTNVMPWSLGAGRQQLCFLPDRLLLSDDCGLASLRYEELHVAFREARFVEEGAVAPDAESVGTTWRYVNKKGGRDKRFRDNREIPILRYGEIEVASEAGFSLVLQCSSCQAGRRASDALRQLSERRL